MSKCSFLPYLLIALGFAVILALLMWQLVREQSARAIASLTVPRNLAGKSLIAQKSGAAALAEIESLHGTIAPLLADK